MVKADPKRNYYADLDLQPGADTEDIRKQFLKLGERPRELETTFRWR